MNTLSLLIQKKRSVLQESRTWEMGHPSIVEGLQSLIVILMVGWLWAPALEAQLSPHLAAPVPGGIPGLPRLTGIEVSSNGLAISWFGPSGYYQLQQKQNVANAPWQSIGSLTASNSAIVSLHQKSALFRVLGPTAHYIGAKTCSDCHAETHSSYIQTEHGEAFREPEFILHGGTTNSACWVCHTVGAGVPSGFSDPSKTPQLAGVQCENCHGPAGKHAASPEDLTSRPHVEPSATLCGGCHNAGSAAADLPQFHPPYYEDWKSSEHATLPPELQQKFATSSPSSPILTSCGQCHSATVREALLEDSPLPNGIEASAVAIACGTCHDPHSVEPHNNPLAGPLTFTNRLTGAVNTLTNRELGAVYTNQVREPFASLTDYHTTGDLKTNYNAAINICAQCHNDRGTSYAMTEEPPHASLQYNLLLGTIGELPQGRPAPLASTHSRIEKQCISCHMQTPNHQSGHQFKVTSFGRCAECHGSADNAQGLASFTKDLIRQFTQNVKTALDQWALTQAPEVLRPYGELAWEYDHAGRLSSPEGTLRGPRSVPANLSQDQQHWIPDNIKKARFNLYLVIQDGSFGVHNGPYAFELLSASMEWIRLEMKP